MENPNISIVQKFYECYASGDLEGMKGVMAEDVEWHIPGHHSLAGTKKGVAEIVAYFKLLQKANFKAEVNILSANDDYVIDCHRGYGEYDGKKIDMNGFYSTKSKTAKSGKCRILRATNTKLTLSSCTLGS